MTHDLKEIMESLQPVITDWDYYVNWEKVLKNHKKIEVALNTLNVLIGADNIEAEAERLFLEHPFVIEALPILLAVREKEVKICTSRKTLDVKTILFDKNALNPENIDSYIRFLNKSGLTHLFANKKIKSIPDYVMGVEVGLDTNGRKNRGGKAMEDLVKSFLDSKKESLDFEYIEQATQKKIKDEWDINIPMDKSNRKIDFAIFKNKQLYLIEVNFYNKEGSKLKSTATEYTEMSQRFSKHNDVNYIWITDGRGWEKTQNPLQEFFEENKNLMNLKMLMNGGLENLLSE